MRAALLPWCPRHAKSDPSDSHPWLRPPSPERAKREGEGKKAEEEEEEVWSPAWVGQAPGRDPSCAALQISPRGQTWTGGHGP